MLKRFPSNRLCLVPPSSGITQTVGRPACSLSEPLGELEMPTSNRAFDSHLETWEREQTMPWRAGLRSPRPQSTGASRAGGGPGD